MENWQGPVMVYPYAGRKGGVSGKWYDHSENNEESIEEYIDAAKIWVDKGVQIVGACCGFGADYIKPLRQIIPAKV
ncbi:MAG: hypothetical protein CL739_08715 [Chloroflexi bacterium]|nr:hypothetical protein [Chloroflexota bacterium]